MPCWVRRESRTKPKPKQGLTQKGNGEETTLSGGYPRPVLSPSPPTWSRTGSGSGSGSEHTHLCPLPSARQRAEQTTQWAQGSRQWGCQGSPQWGLASSLSISPPREGLACSPKPSTEPRAVLGGGLGRPGSLAGPTAGPFSAPGSFQGVVVRGPRLGAPSQPARGCTPTGPLSPGLVMGPQGWVASWATGLQGPSPVAPFLPFTHQPRWRARHFQNMRPPSERDTQGSRWRHALSWMRGGLGRSGEGPSPRSGLQGRKIGET